MWTFIECFGFGGIIRFVIMLFVAAAVLGFVLTLAACILSFLIKIIIAASLIAAVYSFVKVFREKYEKTKEMQR